MAIASDRCWYFLNRLTRKNCLARILMSLVQGENDEFKSFLVVLLP